MRNDENKAMVRDGKRVLTDGPFAETREQLGGFFLIEAENLDMAIEIACTVAYLIHRTRVLGAILMTGVLGGAMVTNPRVGNPAFIAPAILEALVWDGLFLRDERLRAHIPARD